MVLLIGGGGGAGGRAGGDNCPESKALTSAAQTL